MCTIFSLTDPDHALGGNNEDYIDPHTRIWFIPSCGGEINGIPWVLGKYARYYCGYHDLFPEGGMNEKGFFFDFTAVPPLKMRNQKGKKEYDGNFFDYMASECATVEEALALIGEYNMEMLEPGCMFIADATGDSAIVEGDIIIRKNKHFQVLTNFYPSFIDDPSEIKCDRFKIATDMLEKAADNVSVDTVRRILAAVSQSVGTHTVYSQVYDLKRQIIYLYLFHNFESERVINPRLEWKKKEPVIYEIAELFPPNFYFIAYSRKYDLSERGQIKLDA